MKRHIALVITLGPIAVGNSFTYVSNMPKADGIAQSTDAVYATFNAIGTFRVRR